MYSIFIIPMLIVAYFVFIMLHELGHVLMSRALFNDKDWWIELGFGVPIIRTKRLVVNNFFYVGGYAKYTQHEGARWRHIMRCAGGIIINALCIGLLFPFSSAFMSQFEPHSPLIPYLDEFFDVVFFYNLLLIITASLPLKYPWTGDYSDGYWILQYIRRKK